MKKNLSVRSHLLILSGLLLFSLFLIWRLSSPLSDRLPLTQLVNNETDYHDDLSTFQTAKNYHEEGWSKGYGIPNRKGVWTQGYWDIPCSSGLSSVGADKQDPLSLFRNPLGKEVRLYSEKADCFYTHNPSLTDWLWGGFYELGVRSFHEMKLVSTLFHIATCFVFLAFFLRFFPLPAVLFGGGLWMSFYYEVAWSSSLYHHPWQYLWVALLALAVTQEKPRTWLVFLSSFLVFFTNLFLIAVPFVTFFLVAPYFRKKYLALLFSSATLSFLLFYIQRALFFHSWSGPFKDIFQDALGRYQSFENFFPIFTGYITSYFGSWYVFALLFLLALVLVVKNFSGSRRVGIYFLGMALAVWLLRPSYALAHIHQWFSLFCLLYLFIFVLLATKLFSLWPLKRKSVHFVWGILILLPLVSVAFENAFRLKADISYRLDSQKGFHSNDLSKKTLVLFFDQNPIPENPWIQFEGRYALIDGLKSRISYFKQQRPIALKLDSLNDFKLNLHFLEKQSFNVFVVEIDPVQLSASFKCSLQNLDSLDEIKEVQFNAVGAYVLEMRFPQMTGKNFQLACKNPPQTSFYELEIYLRGQK